MSRVYAGPVLRLTVLDRLAVKGQRGGATESQRDGPRIWAFPFDVWSKVKGWAQIGDQRLKAPFDCSPEIWWKNIFHYRTVQWSWDTRWVFLGSPWHFSLIIEFKF